MIVEYRGFLIKTSTMSPRLYNVATAGQGGKIPNVLNSLFTSTGIAKETIDMYLEQKELKNAKTDNQS